MARKPNLKQAWPSGLKGFTLVETMVAIAILSTGLVLLSNSWGGAFMRVRKTQQNFEMAALLERKATEIQLEYKDKPIESIPEERSDTFGTDCANCSDYSWRMSSRKFEMPDMSGAMMAGEDQGVSQFLLQLVKQINDTISKSVKEVQVEVSYQPENGKKISHAITMYFVNYDAGISIGGAPQ